MDDNERRAHIKSAIDFGPVVIAMMQPIVDGLASAGRVPDGETIETIAARYDDLPAAPAHPHAVDHLD